MRGQGSGLICLLIFFLSTAFAPSAVGAALATAVVDQLAAAVGADLVGLGAVLDVAFEGAGHAIALQKPNTALPAE